MRFGKIVLALLAVSFLMGPVVLRAQTPSAPAVAPVIPEAEVQEFINKYIDRFKAMDHEAFMSLFSKEAVENRMLPYADIYNLYSKTFRMTNQFIYQLKIDSIQTYTKSAFVSGHYQIIQTLKENNEMKQFKGNIQWELIREDGSLKIVRLNYGNEM